MAEIDSKRTTRAKGSQRIRSETVTVRLDPRLRYQAELAARKQRRTVSSFIEWSIEDAMERVILAEGYDPEGIPYKTSISDVIAKLWDVDDADRFAKLALNFPDLLNHTEQVLWKLVKENGALWRGTYGPSGLNEWAWVVREESLILERLRFYWEVFGKVARGEAQKSELPAWPKFKTKPPTPPLPKAKPPPDDEDVPF